MNTLIQPPSDLKIQAENSLEEQVSPTNFGRIYSRMSKNGSSMLSHGDNDDIKHSMRSLEKVKTKPAPFKKISPRDRASPKQLKT